MERVAGVHLEMAVQLFGNGQWAAESVTGFGEARRIAAKISFLFSELQPIPFGT
jgi:hypothetical protein